MTTTQSAYFDVIETAIKSQPRTLQLEIGPSEIGTSCEHCLAAKLAGWPQAGEAAWLPFIGTAVHAALEEMFQPPRWLTETRVSVGFIAGKEVHGTSDLFDTVEGVVIDHKVAGATTLKSAKGGPSKVYEAQAHLYGLGQMRAGRAVKNVAVSYLPRNAVSVRQGVWWEVPFDAILAVDALDRATDIANAVLALPEDKRADYISNLPRAKGCYDCPKYADWGHPVPELPTLDELLGVG
jgi:hypothetical protein